MSLINEIEKLRNSPIKEVVNLRLKEFEEFENKDNNEWFSELCFCILTANSRAETAMKIQSILGPVGFLNLEQSKLSRVIQDNHHRFHNNKARFICDARKLKYIKNVLKKFKDEQEARDFLVENVKGIGMKESSHFLRNTGSKNIAILDRHILSLMKQEEIIENIPKPIPYKKNLEIEQKFFDLADKVKMSPAELDLYMWYMKVGVVRK